jgi:2-polyprenyl-6-methoxyphenol hydroxylase-like FAD-dependent oxidoreductase
MIIAVVGAGPVGLYFTIRITEKYPEYKILLFDKRSEYTRHQIVKLPRSSNLPPEIHHNLHQLSWSHPKFYNIELKWIESILSDYIHTLPQVERLTQEVVSVSPPNLTTLEGNTYQYDMYVDASGVKSLMRIEPFLPFDPQGTYYAVNVYMKKCPTKGERTHLEELGWYVLHTDYEFCSLSSQLTKEEFDLKNLHLLPGADIITEQNILDTSFLEITPRSIETASYYVGRVPIFIIGDAAIQTHYFTGSGLETGFYMVDLLVASKNPSKALNRFVSRFPRRLRRVIHRSLDRKRS